MSRDRIVGNRAAEIFSSVTAANIEAADHAALAGSGASYRSELVVERRGEQRILASNRVIARNERNEPEFLIAMFEDDTDRRSLSSELENTKKFLEKADVEWNLPILEWGSNLTGLMQS